MTQQTIKITVEGPRAAGKTLLLKRIAKLLADELGNHTMKIDDPQDNVRREFGADRFPVHFAIVTLCDEDRVKLASPPLAVEIEASDNDEPTFFANLNHHRTVGEVHHSESASLSIPTLSDLRELHRSGELGAILQTMLTKES